MDKMKFSFNMEDASQILVGAFALAVPISFPFYLSKCLSEKY